MLLAVAGKQFSYVECILRPVKKVWPSDEPTLDFVSVSHLRDLINLSRVTQHEAASNSCLTKVDGALLFECGEKHSPKRRIAETHAR